MHRTECHRLVNKEACTAQGLDCSRSIKKCDVLLTCISCFICFQIRSDLGTSSKKQMGGWVDGWMDGRKEAWTGGFMDGWLGDWMDVWEDR